MTHTPGPWKWHGEDYRGNWGWQILVGPDGEGLIIGEEHDGTPSNFCKAFMPVEAKFCITGMERLGKPHVNPVHVYSEANAKLIVSSPELLEALQDANWHLKGIARRDPTERRIVEQIDDAIAKATL